MNFFLTNLIILKSGTVFAKIKSSLILALCGSPIMIILENIFFWYDQNFTYISFVLVAIAIDHILGSYVHACVKRDFNMRKNIKGLFVKTMLVVFVAILVEGLHHIIGKENFIGNYFSTLAHLMVFVYPASSAFINSSVITKGRFPPVAWMERISKFNSNMDMSVFKEKESKEGEN